MLQLPSRNHQSAAHNLGWGFVVLEQMFLLFDFMLVFEELFWLFGFEAKIFVMYIGLVIKLFELKFYVARIQCKILSFRIVVEN